MTVKELIKALSEFPEDMEVWKKDTPFPEIVSVYIFDNNIILE